MVPNVQAHQPAALWSPVETDLDAALRQMVSVARCPLEGTPVAHKVAHVALHKGVVVMVPGVVQMAGAVRTTNSAVDNSAVIRVRVRHVADRVLAALVTAAQTGHAAHWHKSAALISAVRPILSVVIKSTSTDAARAVTQCAVTMGSAVQLDPVAVALTAAVGWIRSMTSYYQNGPTRLWSGTRPSGTRSRNLIRCNDCSNDDLI